MQEQNSFIKSELQQKQIIIEKTLDIKKNQIKNNCFGNEINQSDIGQDDTNSDSNNNTRKKIAVIGNSMENFLRSDEISSVNNAVNVIKHPRSTMDDMVDYVRPVTRKKPNVTIMCVGTNDLTNGVNTISKVRKIFHLNDLNQDYLDIIS